MQHPSDFEQALLEFINRARTDPQGEFDELIVNAATGEAVADNITNALDFFDTDLDLLRDQFDALTPVAPVAWNAALGQSAETHSQLMIDFDEQSHYLGDEPGYLERVTEAGYARPQTVAENIYAFGQDPLHTHAGFFIDWGGTPTGIQNPPGHRNTIMDPVYDEVGLSDLAENDPDTDVGPHVVTQHFATRRDYAQQLVGVVINDTDNDDQYDLGEGMGDITVTAENAADSFITSTWDSGGYQMALPAGTYDVTFSGAALDGVVTASVTIGGENVKLDAQAASASRPASSANPGDEITGSETADTLVGTDADDTIDGHDGDDVIAGRAGNDTLTGGDGDDQIAGSDGDDVIDGGAGRDNIGGGLGNDVIDGGLGRDTIGAGQGDDDAAGGADDDIVNGGAGNDTLAGDTGNDTMGAGFNDDTVTGGAGDDSLGGGTGQDTVDGGAGDDAIGAGEGNDIVTGGDGDDFVAGGGRDDVVGGGAGADTVNGGDGDDTMTGGDGADVFVYNFFKDGDEDIITDYEDGVDGFLIRTISTLDGTPNIDNGGNGLSGFLDALNITDTADGAQLNVDGHLVLVENVAAADLTLDDFQFI